MPSDTFVDNHSSGPQNVVAGCGPQSNLNGTGTQNNYYGPFRDLEAIETEKLRNEKEDCLRSLSFPNMDTRRQNIDDAHPNTCEWLFSTTEFKEWRDRDDLSTHNGVLWVKGKPGAGKSTLMNHTLSYCETAFGEHLVVAYFFNARGGVLEKTPLGMMRSIVYQLLNKDDTLYRIFLDFYREKRRVYNGKELQWQQTELKKFIQSIIKQLPLQSKSLLLLVDALDECDEKEVRGVVGFLETLSIIAINAGAELRICISSRHYPRVSMKKNLELTVEMRQEHETDITAYVREKLYTDDYSFAYQIRKKAGGIFMWVVLVVAMLNKAYDEGRHEAMQVTLDEVPEDLEGIFNTALEKGNSDKAELISMLQWVLFSYRRLTPEELYIAAVSESLPSHDAVRRRIVSSSKGLIEVRVEDTGEEFVQFIHLSVNDFLCRNRRLERLDPTLEPDAISASHTRLWAYCWSYIKRRDTDARKLFDIHQFLRYAAAYMLHHADQALSNGTRGHRWDRDIAQWLVAQNDWGADANAQGGEHGNPLHAAIHYGSYEVIRLLLENGAHVNAQCGYFGNALQLASYNRNYGMVELLLEKGAAVNAQGGYYGNALQAASYWGRYGVAELLLEKGAEVNAQGGQYGNALQAASCDGRLKVVKLLVEKGADVNAQGGVYGTALQAARRRGNEERIAVNLRIYEGAPEHLQPLGAELDLWRNTPLHALQLSPQINESAEPYIRTEEYQSTVYDLADPGS
ncbi:hypothetical protein F4824DRAFT_490871 [Ustulina deusta]|nr:hypothetical protein F4824DRAFT_490871 [Ustulina deusta]